MEIHHSAVQLDTQFASIDEKLDDKLQSQYWPIRSSAMVQQATLLFKELPQRLHA
jgi:hypothetical protein